jgi:citrate lyase subunit beta / citryl-CoA lyase
MAQQKVRRSGLTMPIVTPRFVDNAWRRGCDFVTLDLEDSVPQDRKAYARTLVKDAIPKIAKGGTEPFVRINHEHMQADTEAAVWPGLKRIKYPKTETADEVRALDALITRYEKERGIAPGTIEIDAGIETALAVTNVYDIAAASPRIKEFGATNGGYDMSRDLGVEMFVPYDQFVYLRGEANLAARALGLGVRAAPFIANTSGSVSDGNRALRQAEAARACGLRVGGGGLNPAVVESHNKGYSPSAEDVRDAHWVLEQFERVESSGEPWLEIESRVIDRYEAERARGTLAWAELCAARDGEKAEAVAQVQAAMANK